MSQTTHPHAAGTGRGCNTEDLLLIHALLRYAFGAAPDLVARTAPQDVAQVGRVAAHLQELLTILHDHHQHEDSLYWNLIKERAPEALADVERMQAQHLEVARQIDTARQLLSAWAGQPADRDALVAQLKALHEALESHLTDEEQHIKPVAGRVLTQQEWDRAKQQALKEMPANRRFFQLGYMLQCAPTPALRQAFWQELPPPARWMYGLLGKKQFAREWQDLYGSPP